MATPSITHNPESSPALRFYIWNGEILYLDNAPSRPAPHRVTHDKLMISLSGSFRLWLNGRRIRCRSCLLTTGLWQDPAIIDCSNAVTATWLLPPFSQDVPALAHTMNSAGPGLFYRLPQEEALATALNLAARQGAVCGDEERLRLRQILLPQPVRSQVFRVFDTRVLEVARRIRQTVSVNVPVEQFAAEVGLSGSYLEKLFKAQSGLPITRFRLRYRVYVAAVLLGMGYSITDAALKAGFASSSHFSRTHRAMTGETASRLFVRPGAEAIIERKVVRSVLAVIRANSPPGPL